MLCRLVQNNGQILLKAKLVLFLSCLPVWQNSNWNSPVVFVCGNFIALNLHFSVKFCATRSRFRYLYEEIKGNNGLWERKAWKSDWAFYNPLTKIHLEDLSGGVVHQLCFVQKKKQRRRNAFEAVHACNINSTISISCESSWYRKARVLHINTNELVAWYVLTASVWIL